jgi:hypothetical protein
MTDPDRSSLRYRLGYAVGYPLGRIWSALHRSANLHRVEWTTRDGSAHIALVNGILLKLVRRGRYWHLYARSRSGLLANVVRCSTDLTSAKEQAELLAHEPTLLTWPTTNPKGKTA